MKRIATIILAVAMLVSVLVFAVACSGDKGGTTTQKTEVETTAKGDVTTADSGSQTTTETVTETEEVTESAEPTGKEVLPGYEDVNFGGRTFLIASNADEDGDWADAADFWVEGITNDAINDAVWERNDVMSKLYNCSIEVDNGGWDNGFNAAVASGDDRYIAASSEYALFGGYASGKYYNVLKLGMDLTQDWWDQNFIMDASCDGKLFGIIGDFSLHAMSATWIMFFNKDVYESKFADTDIYQLVRDKKWTLDVMADMIDKIKNDANGDSSYTFTEGADADTLGLMTTAHNYRGLYFASGLRLVTKTEQTTDGSFITALTNQPNGADVIDKLITVCNTEGYISGGYSDVQKGIQNGTTLFAGEVMDVLRRMAGAENLRVGVLPQPLYDEGQKEYHCYVNNRAAFLCIPTSFSDMEVIADFFTLFAYHSSKLVRPAYINTFKYTYANDEESGEMIDIIIDSRVFDPGYLGSFAIKMDGYIGTMITDKKNNYVKASTSYAKSDTANLEAYREKIAAIDDNY